MVTAVEETREAWLGRAAAQLADRLFYEEDVPPLRISVGFPGGGSPKTRIAECWSTGSSEDGVNQIFISPIRGEQQSQDILGSLAHEMIHAIDDCNSGHRGNFARIARAAGFLPKLTSSIYRTAELDARLDEILEIVGPFPHAAIVSGRAADAPKTQKSRQLKLECPEDGYIVRASQKCIDIGVPTCPCGTEMVVA